MYLFIICPANSTIKRQQLRSDKRWCSNPTIEHLFTTTHIPQRYFSAKRRLLPPPSLPPALAPLIIVPIINSAFRSSASLSQRQALVARSLCTPLLDDWSPLSIALGVVHIRRPPGFSGSLARKNFEKKILEDATSWDSGKSCSRVLLFFQNDCLNLFAKLSTMIPLLFTLFTKNRFTAITEY